jgi:hypothetical protein
MTTMDLFVHKPVLTFEKAAASHKAASAQLDENPESWPREILTELFRGTPETSDYMPRVAMLKTDEESGFGLGVVIIENSTDSALATARPGPSSRRVLVPIVIKSHTLCPLDLIMLRSGRMLPLNAHTLREALFRPETFEMTTEDWGDTSLWNQFYPPGRSDNDFGGGISQGIGGGTQGAVTFIQGPGMKLSAEYQLLSRLASTLLGPDLDLVAQAAQEPSKAAGKDSAFLGALQLLAEAEKTALHDASDLIKQAASSVPPDVFQMGWSPTEDQYWLKRASRSSFMAPRPVYLDRADALKIAGADVVRKVDTEGVVTISLTPGKTAQVEQENWEPIAQSGIYKVKTVHGKEMTGWAIPNLIDLDGTHVPMCVFTNGAAAMVQDQIVGVKAGAMVDLPSGPPKGTGCFFAAGKGGVIATVPLLVEGAESGMNGGESWLAKSLTGEETRVRVVPGIETMVALKGEFHVPSGTKFLPLNDERMVALIDRVDQVTKTAADAVRPTITLFGGDHDEVSVRFQAMPKLASVTNPRLTHDDAALLLCLAGLPAKTAYTKIASAAAGNTVVVPGLLDVRLASDLIEQTRKIASSRSHEVRALRQLLVKEAATLPDAMTVDAVLSLGFINSENVRMFTSSIPYLEKCLSKICELVLGSRLGLTEIPEFAAARAARALDDVIQGLKALALRDVQEGASAGS